MTHFETLFLGFIETSAPGRHSGEARLAWVAAGAAPWSIGAFAACACSGRVSRNAGHRRSRRTACERWLQGVLPGTLDDPGKVTQTSLDIYLYISKLVCLNLFKLYYEIFCTNIWIFISQLCLNG